MRKGDGCRHRLMELHLPFPESQTTFGQMLNLDLRRSFPLMAFLAAIACDKPPEVNIDSPSADATVAEAVSVSVTAVDDDSVARVELWVDGDSTGLVDDTEPFSFWWNTAGLPDRSPHDLAARAYDIADNWGESDTVRVTVDNRRSYPEPRAVESTSFMNGRYTLNWSPAGDGDFASYRIERSDSPDMTDSEIIFTADRRAVTTYTDRGMDALQHNYYRIVVVDTLGFESPGPVLTSDLYPLPLAANVTTVSYDYDAMTVVWSPSSGQDFQQYTLLTATSEGGRKRTAATYDDPTITTHAITDFDPTRENWFWVLTTNVFEQTSLGGGETNTPDPPPAPVAVSAVRYNLKKMVIDWAASPDDDFRRYEVLHSRTQEGIRTVVASLDAPEITRHQITDFDPTHENWFWVRVTDHWGQTSVGDGKTNRVDAPPKPIAVTSVTYDLEKMRVEWQRSRDRDFLSYEVLHSESEMGEKRLLDIITDPKSTSYELTDFDPAHENWFWVRVTDHWGLTYKGVGMTHETDAPPAAVDVDSVWYDERKMTITWSGSDEADFSNYRLYTSEAEYTPRRSIVKIGERNRTNYTLRHFDPTRENWFWVEVADIWGLTSSGRGLTNEVNQPPDPLRVLSVDYDLEEFRIVWEQSVHSDFAYYDLLVSTEREGRQRRLVTLPSAADTSYAISGRGAFDPTREHWFQVRTGDAWGQEVTGPGYRVLDDPPAPSYLHPIEYRKNRFIITWNANGEDDFNRYNLYESTRPDMVGEAMISTVPGSADTTSVLTGIDPWEVRYYRLEVEDVWGLRSSSDVVMGDSESWFIATLGDAFHEEGRSVYETADGGFIVAGHTYANEENGDVWLVKTDPKGNIDWAETYGGDGDDHAYSVQVTSDGGYVMAGFSEALAEKWSDAWVIKTDDRGRVEWNRTYGGFRWDKAHAVRQTSDGGYVITGYTFSHGSGNADIWLIRADASGYPVWTNTFGGPDWEYGYAVEQTADGGFIITGFTETEGKESSRLWLVKTDSEGNEEWTRTFGNREHNSGYFVQRTGDGGFIVVGSTQAFFPNYEDVLLIRTDANGEALWEKTFGGQSWDRSTDVREADDGGFALAGSTRLKEEGNADPWLLKLDGNGEPVWRRAFESASSDEVYSLQLTTDGGFVMTGSSAPIDGSPADLLLIKTDARGNTPTESAEPRHRLGAAVER